MNNDLITAGSLWRHTKDPYAALRAMGASRTVARALQDRLYTALPCWIKLKLIRDAREARALLKNSEDLAPGRDLR
jgi:hypothetical protein